MREKANGFSLIELLIVVGIIMIIAAIAIPNLLKSKIAANEAATTSAERVLSTANATYNLSYHIGYAGNLGELGPPSSGSSSSANADLIDSVLAGGIGGSATVATKGGYIFTYTAPNNPPANATPNSTYSVVATPVSPNATGASTFCLDHTNVVRKDSTGAQKTAAATGCDPANWPTPL